MRLRCDAGALHGLGHLARGLCLASELQRHGAEVEFALGAPSEICARVTAQGFAVKRTPDLGPNDDLMWLEDPADLIILDSKNLDESYAAKCGEQAPVVYFDDEEARDLPSVGVINNNVWADRDDYPARNDRIMLLGPSFNTVDPRYFELAGTERDGLLITLGGEDPANHTAWLIETLTDRLLSLSVDICIGPAHPDPDGVERAAAEYVPNAKLHRAPSSLLELFSRCNVALSAGGTTCYELAAAGIPAAILSVESHQDRMRQAMCDAGTAVSLGSFDTLDPINVREVLDELLDPANSKQMSYAAQRLIPLPGVHAIVASLTNILESSTD